MGSSARTCGSRRPAPVVHAYLRLGIVCVLDDNKVPWHLSDGTFVAGGLFGEEKPHSTLVQGGKSNLLALLRLIISPKAYQRHLSDDIAALSAGFRWSSLALRAREIFSMST